MVFQKLFYRQNKFNCKYYSAVFPATPRQADKSTYINNKKYQLHITDAKTKDYQIVVSVIENFINSQEKELEVFLEKFGMGALDNINGRLKKKAFSNFKNEPSMDLHYSIDGKLKMISKIFLYSSAIYHVQIGTPFSINIEEHLKGFLKELELKGGSKGSV